MTAFLLVALFATVAVASALTIADAAVRGHSALRSLRVENARGDALRMITVTMEGIEGTRMPALRSVPAVSARSARRCAVRSPAPMRAAA